MKIRELERAQGLLPSAYSINLRHLTHTAHRLHLSLLVPSHHPAIFNFLNIISTY